ALQRRDLGHRELRGDDALQGHAARGRQEADLRSGAGRPGRAQGRVRSAPPCSFRRDKPGGSLATIPEQELPSLQKCWAILFGAVVAAAAGLFVVAPLIPGWWLPKNMASYGPDVDHLFYLILGFTGFFYFLTEGIMVYAMWKYIARPGEKSIYTHGSHKL